MRNLLCLHYGTKYGPEYVKNLWKGAAHNSQASFNFYVMTEAPEAHPHDLGWHFLPVPSWRVTHPWWFKLGFFDPALNLEGQNLYLDLDTVIVGNIDKFWDWRPGTFRICQDFNRAFSSEVRFTNSSVMAWPNSSQAGLYQTWMNDPASHQREHRGDQDFIHTYADETWWPTDWAQSWKWEIKTLTALRPDTSVIVCHGKPDVHEVPELISLWNK